MKLASFFRGYWRAKLVGLIDLFVKCEHLYRIVANNSWYEQALKVFFFSISLTQLLLIFCKFVLVNYFSGILAKKKKIL